MSIIRKKKLLETLQERNSDPFAIKEGTFRFGQLKDSVYYSDWTEQSFLSDSSAKEIVSRSFNFKKLRFFAFIAGAVLLAILSRTIWLQIIKNDYYYLLSEDNRLRAEIIEPKRGIVYDKEMKPLVRNKANFVLYLRPIDLPRNELARDELIREISLVLVDDEKVQKIKENTDNDSSKNGLSFVSDNSSFYKIKEALSTVKIGSLESYQPLFIEDNIDYDKAMTIHLKLSSWPGVFLTNKIKREYLTSGENGPEISGISSLSHILGYTGKINDAELKKSGKKYSMIDYIGKVGIEFFWESELKGQAGRKNIEVDALGRRKKIINEVPAKDGSNLLLSLDLELQKKTEEITKTYLEKGNFKRASIIIINPNNGEILTMVSWPAFDNNSFAMGISQEEYSKFLNDVDQPLFNRSIAGEFPSGSTIKPVFASGALQEGIINENTSFLSNGGLRIGEWYFPDWKAGGHGMTDVKRAIAFSVNTFFYYIGGGYGDFKGLGINGLVKYSKLFGLGELTGIDLNGEADGFVPTSAWKEQTKNEPWYIGDTYHFAIGQGDVIVTPLQVANYTAVFANGGTLYVPHLVSKILDSNNQLIKEIAPIVVRDKFIDKQNMDIVRAGMRQTVLVGSANRLSSLPVSAAGKTGTAQWSSKKANHAWFMGFAPYENPELAITVLVEEGIEGSAIAVPIAHDILNWYFSNKNIVSPK